MSDTTKQRLIDGTLAAIREYGIAGVSARTIAAAAGVNQALVFYHYGTVDDLLMAACEASTAARVSTFAPRFGAVTTFRGLLDLGRALHAEERELGNVFVLAQMLAGAQRDERLAAATSAALHQWIDQIEPVLRRLMADSPLAKVADVGGLARALAASFIGLELFEGVDPSGAHHAFDAFDQLAVLIEVVDGLDAVSKKALRVKINRTLARRRR